jgi:ABC-type transport system substrate-binding protein
VTGSAPTEIALTGDDLWVTTVARTDGAHRGGTLRVTADRRPDSIDPAFGYASTAWSILSVTNDGLVGYRRADGVSGTTLVPDLATALPEPTDAGRRYTFQLRPNISFSDGEPVTPDAFRTAIERSLRLGTPRPDYYASIVGAPACIAAPDRCDLSEESWSMTRPARSPSSCVSRIRTSSTSSRCRSPSPCLRRRPTAPWSKPDG